MVMNVQERTNTLKRIKESEDNIGSMNIVLHGQKKQMPTFEVNLDSVIFNKENGRIRTKVLTHENLNGELNQEENHEDEDKISDFIWNSSLRKNKETLESLKNYGQQTACVVTADGVIVGGNRRVCCMRRLTGRDKPTYFETVILDEKYDGNKSVLLKLEKILQHGVDSQEDYGANEKYYEVYDMAVDLGATQNANKKWSGLENILDELILCMPRYKKASKSASVKAIEEDLSMKDLFDEYLNLTKAPGIITQLDKKEGYFVDLLPSIDSYKPDHDAYADRKLKRAEIAKWKEMCFYVTKAQFQGGEGSQKLYRDLFKRDTKKHGLANMFGNSKSWEFIKKEWEEKIDPIIDTLSSFEELQQSTQNPQEEVQREESKFQEEVEGPLTGIFKQAKIIIDEDINKISAEENLQKAFNYLSKINPDREWPPEIQSDSHAKSIKESSNDLRKLSDQLYRKVKDW